MGSGSERHGLDRVTSRLGEPDIVDKLAADIAPSDLTTLMLAVAERRAARVDSAGVLRRYRSDRFSRPSMVPFAGLREVEDLFIEAVPGEWSWLVPSPLVPFGTHAALGDVSQDWVVTAVRPNEAAADPTVALALEAAVARKDSSIRRAMRALRLATMQRIVRAQLYASPKAFTHFSIFALATAGRGLPGERFEHEALTEHLAIYVSALTRVSEAIEVVLSTGDDQSGRKLLETLRDRWQPDAKVRVSEDPRRLPAQRYYRKACFKVHATMGGDRIEIADGGFTDWMSRLLDDRRERLLISGAGLDRPALALETIR
jgi:hypothetical protein